MKTEVVTDEARIKEAWIKGYNKGTENGKDAFASNHSRELERMQKLQNDVAEFERQSGISIRGGWNNQNIGLDLRNYIKRQKTGNEYQAQLDFLHRQALNIAEAIKSELKANTMIGELTDWMI